jgi:putative heme iron utilization protein
MKQIAILITVLILSIQSFGQSAKMTMKYGTEIKEVNQLLQFQNIFIEAINFKDSLLNGKFYQLFIQEFKNGILVNTDTLFDGTESEYFKIKGDSLSFKFYTQIENNVLKVQFINNRFSSKKSTYTTFPNNREYVLKNFLGSKKELEIPIDKPFYIFAIITPTINKDGSGSYCSVAQSDTDPEQFGTNFKIPHYFLIQMKFK